MLGQWPVDARLAQRPRCQINKHKYQVSDRVVCIRFRLTGFAPYYSSIDFCFFHLQMFSCLTCTYTTSDRRTIERHKMVHTGEKPYACTDCSFRTSRRDTLNNHIRCRHPETFGLLLMAQQQQQDIGNNDYVE